jgi:hypothetical protein
MPDDIVSKAGQQVAFHVREATAAARRATEEG